MEFQNLINHIIGCLYRCQEICNHDYSLLRIIEKIDEDYVKSLDQIANYLSKRNYILMRNDNLETERLIRITPDGVSFFLSIDENRRNEINNLLVDLGFIEEFEALNNANLN